VFEDTILLLQEDRFCAEFSLWRIPPLRPVPENCLLDCEVEIFRLQTANQWCYPAYQPCWFRPYPEDTCHIDFLGKANNEQNAIARYVLKSINRNGDLDLPPFIPNLTSRFLPHKGYPTFEWVPEFDSFRLWDNSALLLWMEDQTLVANLSQIVPNSVASSSRPGVTDSPSSEDDKKEDDDWPWGAGKSISTILYDNIDHTQSGVIAHCPMSGRLCVLSSNEVHVVDYLEPPA
jgi:hypothetical protein